MNGVAVREEAIAGRYELVEQLSFGGMGQVWRGYDAVLDREVAVKLIRPDVVTTAEMAEEFAMRFRREARVTARIQHHGVPQVYDAVLDREFDRVYLVMELVHGTSLRKFIDPASPLPVPWAAAIAAQICTVLSHAHAIPVVHRDLKPDNVLVCPDGAVKVLDFGIAALLRPDATKLTARGDRPGTSLYMAPEQIQSGRISPHTDLYALGCVLHELLAGSCLFDGTTDYELYQQHVLAAPQPVRGIRPDVPAELEALVLSLLAKAPEDRPTDAYDVYDRLLPFLPLPGTRVPTGAAEPSAVPDPTVLFRRPNPPRLRIQAEPDRVPTPPAGAVPADTKLQNEIKAAEAHAAKLAEDGRFIQAAELIESVIPSAKQAFGRDGERVLQLRSKRAAILFLAGDYRRALPEFDTLATAYGRSSGPTSAQALQCLRQAAHCRAGLGFTTDALNQFEQVLHHVRNRDGDASPLALELRHDVAVLVAERDAPAAITQFGELYSDLLLVYGPDHDETQEVADILQRLRQSEAYQATADEDTDNQYGKDSDD